MDYALTFLEGIVTFVSPCLLPLLPVYVAYFAGGGGPDGPGRPGGLGASGERGGAGAGDKSGLRHTLACALGFVLGFTLLFVLLGAFAGTLGSLLVRHRRALSMACGLVMVLLGLNYLGVLRIPLLGRTARLQRGVAPRSFGSSVLFGVVFALGWTPCVGTFLASALSLAASSASAAAGVGLLLCYSLGLGLPFVLSALLISQLEGAFTWIKAHYDVVNRTSGALLVALGTALAAGLLG